MEQTLVIWSHPTSCVICENSHILAQIAFWLECSRISKRLKSLDVYNHADTLSLFQVCKKWQDWNETFKYPESSYVVFLIFLKQMVATLEKDK